MASNAPAATKPADTTQEQKLDDEITELRRRIPGADIGWTRVHAGTRVQVHMTFLADNIGQLLEKLRYAAADAGPREEQDEAQG